MGILDNLEAYLEVTEVTESIETCYYCQAVAKYNDLAEVEKDSYEIVGVCACHSFKGLSS